MEYPSTVNGHFLQCLCLLSHINEPSVDPVVCILFPEGFHWMRTLRIWEFGRQLYRISTVIVIVHRYVIFWEETLLLCSSLFGLSLVWFYPLHTDTHARTTSTYITEWYLSNKRCCHLFAVVVKTWDYKKHAFCCSLYHQSCNAVKVTFSRYRPCRPLGIRKVKASGFFRLSAVRRW